MQISRFTIPVLTSAGGAANVFSPNFTGEILAVHVIVPGSGGIASAAIAATSEATGEPILSVSGVSASAFYYPRSPRHTDAGVAQLYAAAGLPVTDRFGLAQDRIAFAITGAGNAKAATIIVIVAG